MALIKCPECGREISDKANVCIGCGFPIKEHLEEAAKEKVKEENEKIELEREDKILLDKIYVLENGQRIKIINALRQEKEYDLKIAKKIVDIYWNERFPTKELYYTKQKPIQEKEKFSGIYEYSLFGKKKEVYCPRCGSINCSHYQEQKIIPGKIKTSYTANLNPLKPFILVNKKEKIIREEKLVTDSKIICNDCGYIFN